MTLSLSLSQSLSPARSSLSFTLSLRLEPEFSCFPPLTCPRGEHHGEDGLVVVEAAHQWDARPDTRRACTKGGEGR